MNPLTKSAISSTSSNQSHNLSLIHSISNGAVPNLVYDTQPNVQCQNGSLGIPNKIPTESTTNYRGSNQTNYISNNPPRSPSPNLFTNKEFGGTVEAIRNRFTSDNYTPSPKKPQNYAVTSPVLYQQQHYPLLDNLKHISEHEIRRNKKG